VRILLVEDEERIIRFVIRGLQAESHDVMVAQTKNQWVPMATVQSYDLIIVDACVGKNEGVNICKILRQQRVFTPILLFTAPQQEKLQEGGTPICAMDHLSKPFGFEELLEKIRFLTSSGSMLVGRGINKNFEEPADS